MIDNLFFKHKTISIVLLVMIIGATHLSLNAQNGRRDTHKSIPYKANYKRVASGCFSVHGFEIRNGQLWGWGDNSDGQLGDGTTTVRLNPVQIGTDSNWVNVSTGQLHSIGLKADGTLWGWGYNGTGCIGDGTTTSRTSPVQIGTDNKWISISAGNASTTALKSDGTLWAWGYNRQGQLGDGTTFERDSPVQIGFDTDWVKISVEYSHGMALKSNGSLWAWGGNFNGQLGDGSTTNRTSPRQIGSDTDWEFISTSPGSSYAIKSNGTLWSWGANDLGQLGDGTTLDNYSPERAGYENDWVAISAGSKYVVALKSNGTLWTWGENQNGQLGDGTTANDSIQKQVGTENDWVAIATGGFHNIMLKSNGTLWAWGRNSKGQLGTGDNIEVHVPRQIGTSRNEWITVEAGRNHSHGLKSNGTLWAWGYNAEGQLGINSTVNQINPTQLGSENNWVSIKTKSFHTLAIQANGTLWSWGRNANGQLGNGTTNNDSVPKQVGTDNKWASIAVGEQHSLGLKSDGTLWSWGYSDTGALGTGASSDQLTPVQIGSDNNWVSIEAGSQFSMGLKGNGTIWTWGENSAGQLGDGSTTNRTTPNQVGTDTKWISIEGGNVHALAVKSNGTLWAWGNNAKGALGDGSNTMRTSPVQIGADKTWLNIATGDQHSLSNKADGNLFTWGNNAVGSLGNGTTTDSNSPAQIGADKNWVNIKGGSSHSIGLKADRKNFCATGYNAAGQLGDGTTNDSYTFTCNTSPACSAPSPPTAANVSICSGNAASLSASGAGTIAWYSAASGGTYLGGGSTFLSSVLITDTVFYVQDSTCYASSSRTAVNVTVNPSPTVTATASATSICLGDSISLIGNGADTYVWSNAVSNGVAFSPSSSTTYTLTGTNTNNCSNTDSIHVTVNSLPNVSANASASTICSGDSISLSGSGALSYSWSNAVDNAVSFAPANSNTYTLTGTDTNNCSNTDTIHISLNNLPDVVANSSATTICLGDSILLSASGANTYTWSPSVNNGEYFYPSSTLTYNLTGTDINNCNNTDSIRIIVNSLPNVIANASADTICSGASLTLFGLGAENYSWTDGVTDSISFQPTSSQSYILTGTDTNGCSNTDSLFITVNPNSSATVSANASSQVICKGDSVILTGSGANSYTWSNGVLDGVAFAPSSSSTYTLTGTDSNACTNTYTLFILVNTLPIVSANASATAVCDNDSVLLYGSGTSFYAWTGGVNDSLYFIPTSTLSYTVTGTDDNNCSNWDTISILKSNSTGLAVTATASANTICQGDSVRLKGSGADSYSWSGGIMDGINFSPAITTTYTLTGSNANGCNGTTTNTITVKGAPAVAANASLSTICVGDSVWVFGEGANTYSWTNAILDTVKFAPSQTAIYTVIGTDSDNCSAMDSIQITVYSLPLLGVSASVSDSLVCFGDTVILSGSGASNYYWTGGVKDREPFNPTRSATYTLTGITENTCDNRTSINININPLPILTPLARPSSAAICIGASVTLTGAGAETYVWSDSVMDGEAFFPTSTKTYTLTGTDTNRCINSVIRVVSVFPLPEVGIRGKPDTTLCYGDSVTLWATGALTYIWSDNITDSVAFFPTSSNIYSVTGKDNYSCSNTAYVSIEVDSCKDEVIIIGIQESSIQADEIKVYPNPNKGAFTISLSEIQGKQIQSGNYKILNELGQTIQEFNLNSSSNYSIHIENLNSGIYFIVGGSGNEIIRQKVLVMH